ncbi:heparinase II/III family protein [Paenibacillus sp. YN15]|uniref:heparinase II/III domain-containing protein n=1 Tax=Paenibacillus sp. YN15 TaxID=1742774 RepID=UPI000DCD9D32|nr:heparinase II/III family protein [Paenibacillus sp. YN15]RAV00214.1 hypothetical protein DQG13_14775 [Paenibacillus sp. YN15]
MTIMREESGTKEEQRYSFICPPEFGEARSIRLTLEADSPQHEAYEIVLLAPDEQNAYAIPEIRADWAGTTFFQLDLDNWTKRGTPQGWDRATGLILRRLRDGYGNSGVGIADFEALPTNMEIKVYDDETVIDYQYMDYLSQFPQWRASGPISGKQGSYAGGSWRLLESSASCPTIHRELSITLEGFRALEFYGTAAPQLQWRPRFLIDGSTVTGDWQNGEGKLVKALFVLPEEAKRLASISIELRRNGPSQPGVPATLVMYTIAKVKRTKPWTDTPRSIPADLMKICPAGGVPPRPEGTFLLNAAEFARFREAAREGFGRPVLSFWRSCADRLAAVDFPAIAGTILPARYCGADKYPGCLDGLYSEWSLNLHTNMDFGLAWSLKVLTRAYLADGRPSYGETLARLLIAVCSIEKWLWVHVGSFPNGAKQDLPFAKEIAPDVAEAYDAVRHLLSPAQREYALDAIVFKGLYPTHDYVRRNPSVMSMNQGLVYAATLGLGAMPLLRDRPQLQAIFDDAERWLYAALDGYLFSDGGCAEGTAYWMYSLEVGSRFLAALAKQNPRRFREKLPEGARRTMEYPIYLRSNSFLDGSGALARVGVNINDRGSPLFDLKLPACLLAKYADSEAARKWLAGLELDLELLWCWPDSREELGEGLGGEPLGRLFPVSGFIVSRSGYEFGDFLVLQQNGPHRPGGHTQLDRGALLIECYGEQLGLDSGTISYEDPRSARLKDTDLHPHTITIGDSARQRMFGPGGEPAAQVTRYLHSPAADYNRADLTVGYPELTLYERDLFYFRPHLLLCIDRMEAEQPFAAHYHLNSEGVTTVEGSRAVSSASFSKLVSRFLPPPDASGPMSVWPTNSRALNHHVDLTFAAAEGTCRQIAAVHEVLQQGEEEAFLDAAKDGGLLTIRKRNTMIVFACQAGSEPIENGWFRSDGRYAYVIYEKDEPSGFGVVDGTYLSVKGNDHGTGNGFGLVCGTTLCAFAEIRKDGRLVLAPSAGKEEKLRVSLPPGFAEDRRIFGCSPSGSGTVREPEDIQWEPAAGSAGLPGAVSFRLPEDTGDAQWILIGGAPPAMPLQAEACTVEVAVDGATFPSGTRVPYGHTPRRIEAVLHSPNVPFDRELLEISLDGRDMAKLAAVRWSEANRTVKVAVDIPPDGGALDRSRHAHSLSVRAVNSGIGKRQAHAFVQFYTEIAGAQPIPLTEWPVQIVSGRTVTGWIRPNPQLMTSCYRSGGYPIKACGVEYGDAVHCELGRHAAFEAVYELPALKGSWLFTGAWAIDDGAGVDELPGRATIELAAAGEEAWKASYESPPLKRYGEPAPFSIRLDGAKRMRLRCVQGSSIVLLRPRFTPPD